MTPLTTAEQSGKTLTTVIYALYALSILLPYTLGITATVAIAMNYAKRGAVADTFLASHFRWQMRTFWWSMLWAVLGSLLLVFFIGGIILIVDGVWFIYRLVKGWLRLNDNLPMYEV